MHEDVHDGVVHLRLRHWGVLEGQSVKWVVVIWAERARESSFEKISLPIQNFSSDLVPVAGIVPYWGSGGCRWCRLRPRSHKRPWMSSDWVLPRPERKM